MAHTRAQIRRVGAFLLFATAFEVANGGCGSPAECGFECNGHYYVHLYSCS